MRAPWRFPSLAWLIDERSLPDGRSHVTSAAGVHGAPANMSSEFEEWYRPRRVAPAVRHRVQDYGVERAPRAFRQWSPSLGDTCKGPRPRSFPRDRGHSTVVPALGVAT